MTDGIVKNIVGGGLSTDASTPATVTSSSIIINGGTVTQTAIGGGFLYSNVQTSNVTINNGNVSSVIGGGLASTTIDGVNYNSGSAENPKASGTRVENANVTLNGGTFKYQDKDFGTVFGGGQGYSYTGNANVTLNGGDLSKAYVTAGGSNGYTGKANVEINGPTVNIVQSTNRGTVDEATVRLLDGTVNNFYVGGETNDPTVDGIINKTNVYLLGGNINTLEPGTSNNIPLTIDGSKNAVTKTDSVKITDNKIPTPIPTVKYNISLPESSLTLKLGQSAKLEPVITTEPTGYEDIFTDQVQWTINDPLIATVSNDGTVTGVNVGNTVVSANLLNQTASATVTVEDNSSTIIGIIVLILLVLLIIALLLFVIFGILL